MSFCLCLSLISLGPYAEKDVVEIWRFRKKIKKGGGGGGGEGVQVVYRRRVQCNLHAVNLLMFDIEMGRPIYFRKFHSWLLIYFDL